MERTLVVIKPDAVQRRLVGEVIARLERKGLRIAACRMRHLDEPTARDLYSVHVGKDFYEPLVAFITSGPLVALAAEGQGAIEVVRTMIGPTFGAEAPPGTVRGDFGLSRRHNLVHASDSPKSARRELAILFDASDFASYDLCDERWVYPE